MSVVNVKRSLSGQRGDAGEGGSTRVRIYTVLVDDADDDESTILYAVDPATNLAIPAYNDPLEGDGTFGCRGKDAERQSAMLWQITATFKRAGGSGGYEGADPEEDPLSRAPQYSWFTVASREPIDKDADDHAILNAADEPFDPPIEEDFYDVGVRIRQNLLTFSAAEYMAYGGATNKSSWRGAAAGTAKIADIRAETMRSGEIRYYERAVEIILRPDGWKRRILNQGFRERTGTDTNGKPTYKQIVDEKGKPITSAVLLAADGTRLADGATPVWLYFRRKPEVNFSSLGI